MITKLFMMALATVLSVQGLSLDAFEISSNAFSMLTGIKPSDIPCDPFVLAAPAGVCGQDEVGKWRRKAGQADQKLREEKYKLDKCKKDLDNCR